MKFPAWYEIPSLWVLANLVFVIFYTFWFYCIPSEISYHRGVYLDSKWTWHHIRRVLKRTVTVDATVFMIAWLLNWEKMDHCAASGPVHPDWYSRNNCPSIGTTLLHMAFCLVVYQLLCMLAHHAVGDSSYHQQMRHSEKGFQQTGLPLQHISFTWVEATVHFVLRYVVMAMSPLNFYEWLILINLIHALEASANWQTTNHSIGPLGNWIGWKHTNTGKLEHTNAATPVKT